MPLKSGSSKKVVSGNIKELMSAYKKKGKIGTSNPKNKRAAQKQSVAIALSKARESIELSGELLLEAIPKGVIKKPVTPDAIRRERSRGVSSYVSKPPPQKPPTSEFWTGVQKAGMGPEGKGPTPPSPDSPRPTSTNPKSPYYEGPKKSPYYKEPKKREDASTEYIGTQLIEKLCAKGKAAAQRKFDVYPSAYANMYASAVCSGKVKPGGKKK